MKFLGLCQGGVLLEEGDTIGEFFSFEAKLVELPKMPLKPNQPSRLKYSRSRGGRGRGLRSLGRSCQQLSVSPQPGSSGSSVGRTCVHAGQAAEAGTGPRGKDSPLSIPGHRVPLGRAGPSQGLNVGGRGKEASRWCQIQN